jgi:hypothetical protein
MKDLLNLHIEYVRKKSWNPSLQIKEDINKIYSETLDMYSFGLVLARLVCIFPRDDKFIPLEELILDMITENDFKRIKPKDALNRYEAFLRENGISLPEGIYYNDEGVLCATHIPTGAAAAGAGGPRRGGGKTRRRRSKPKHKRKASVKAGGKRSRRRRRCSNRSGKKTRRKYGRKCV